MAIELPALIQKVRVDVSEMSKAENVARKLGSAFDDVDVSASKAERGMRGVRTETEKSTPIHRRNNSELGVLVGKFRDAGKHGAVLSTVISTMKVPALVYAVKLATAAIGDLAAGAVGLVGAMAPAAGAVAALPAAYLAVGSSVGVLKVATSGSLEAAKAIAKYGANSKQAQEALKNLSPEARKFTTELGLMQKQWEGVTKATQASTLPGLTQALKNLQPVIPVVSQAMAQAGKSIAGVAVEGSKMISSGPFRADLATIGSNNAKVITSLGGALLSMVSALRHLMIAAAPLTQWMADSINQGAKWINTVTEQGRASGRLAAFFDRTRTVLSQLGRILRDFGAALVNVFSIGGKNLGQPLLDGLERIMARFRAFTESTEGKNTMADFFQKALPPLQALGRLIGALGGVFGRFATSADIAPLLDTITTRWVPAFEALTNMVSDRMGPALLLAGEAFIKFQGILSFSPMIEVVTVFSKMVIAIADLAGRVPMLGTIIASLLALKMATRGLSFAFNITGITSLIGAFTNLGSAATVGERGIAGFIAGLRGATGQGATLANRFGAMFTGMFSGFGRGGMLDDLRLRVMYAMDGIKGVLVRSGSVLKTAASGVANGIISGFSVLKTGIGSAISGLGSVFSALIGPIKAAAVAVKGFTVALLTNPVFLIIAAIVALVAALIYAYKHFEGFRNVVNATFSFIRDFIVGAISGVANFLKATWDGIVTIFTTVFETIKTVVTAYFTLYATIITGAINIIRTILVGAWNGVVTVFTTVFNLIKATVVGSWNAITTAVTTAVNLVRSVVSTGWNAIVGVVSTVWNAVLAIIRAAWSGITSIVSGAINTVRAVLTTGWNLVTGIFRTAWNLIKGAVTTGIGAVVSLITTLPGKVVNALGNLGRLLFDAGKRIVQGLIDGIMSMFSAVGRAISNIVGFIRDHLPFSPARVGPLSGRGDPYYAGQTIVQRLANGLVVAREQVGEATSKLVQEIADYLPHSPAKKGPLSPDNDPRASGVAVGTELASGMNSTKSALLGAGLGMASTIRQGITYGLSSPVVVPSVNAQFVQSGKNPTVYYSSGTPTGSAYAQQVPQVVTVAAKPTPAPSRVPLIDTSLLAAAQKALASANVAYTAQAAALRGYDRNLSIAANNLRAVQQQAAESGVANKALITRLAAAQKSYDTAKAAYDRAAKASSTAYSAVQRAAVEVAKARYATTSTSKPATTTTTTRLVGGTGGSASTAAAAAQTRATAAAQALATAVDAAKTKINDLSTTITDIASQITARLNEIFQAARGQMLGFMAITAGTAPTGGWKTADQLIKSMTDRLAQAKEYTAGISQLSAAGLDKDIIAQLIDAGVSGGYDQVKALMGSLLTPGQPNLDMIKQINALQVETRNVANAFGTIAKTELGPRDDQIISLNKQMVAKQNELATLIRGLPLNVAKALGAVINAALIASGKASAATPIANAIKNATYSKTPTAPIIAAKAGYDRVWNGYEWTYVPNPAAKAIAAASTPTPAPSTITTAAGTQVSGWLTLNGVAYASVADLVAALAALQQPTTVNNTITNNVLKDQTPADATASTLRTLSSLGMF